MNEEEQEQIIMAANAATTVITVRTIAPVRPWSMIKADSEGKNVSQFFSLAMVYMMKYDLSPKDIAEGVKARKALQSFEDQHLKAKAISDKYKSELDQERTLVASLRQRVKELESEISQMADVSDDNSKHYSTKLDGYSKKIKELTSANKELTGSIAQLSDRLNKANKRLSKENVKDYPNGVFNAGVVAQY